jgi:CheY-like chemotaxis protein
MKRILFVDDEPNVLSGLRRMLRPMGKEWEMVFASGGEEALVALAENHFDVLVSDMRMPGMDGAQLLSEVKRRHPEVVRIVLSGHSEKETVLQSVGLTHQYLAKPCDADQLRDAIGRACALHGLLRENGLRELVSRISTIPSLPKTYTEMMEELHSPDTSIKRVGKIIARDVGMTAKVLQLVNSAFFGLPHHVSDPSQAASFLGVDTLKALVLSVHIFSQLDDVTSTGLSVTTLWDHCVATGALAKHIATAEGCTNQVRDHALMAGLLHDAGKLVIAANLPEQYRSVFTFAETEGLQL